jgi:EmrB/QacA subfamily drug resistance transporter
VSVERLVLYKWVALSVTTFGMLMVGVDARIVTLGLPAISQQLGASVNEVVWINQSYILLTTVSLLLIGRVADIFGRVRLYNIGFMIFTLGTALASLSFNPEEVIFFRGLQGFGAALLQGNSGAILTDATPVEELGSFFGLNTISLSIGALLGISLSGVLLAYFDWRSLFWVNIPFGIFGTVWGWKMLKEISVKDKVATVDWVGFGLFASGITLMLLAITILSYGQADIVLGSFAFVGGMLLIVYFFYNQSKKKHPLLDPHLFRMPAFTGLNISNLFTGLTFFGSLILLTLYLQVGLGMSTLQASVGILPLQIGMLIGGPVSGRLADRYNPTLFIFGGTLVGGAGILLLAALISPSTPFAAVAVASLLIGLSNSIAGPASNIALMRVVPPNRRGISQSLNNTMFNVGNVVSYGFVVLLITIAIPYASFTILVQNPNPLSLVSSVSSFIQGARIAAIVLGILRLVALVPLYYGLRNLKAQMASPGGVPIQPPAAPPAD